MFLYTVEGNIGSGKSTFLDILKNELKHVNGIPVVFIEEPVDEWESIQSDDGKSMIELFYADKEKYAFSFQIMAYISRLKCLQQTIEKYPNCILISERSLLADYHVFADMLYHDKLMSTENYLIYTKWFHYFSETSQADGIIYLKTDPILCYQRCISRNRKGEEIPLDYLIGCSEKHDIWIGTELIPTLVLSDNTPNEVELVKKFIQDDMEITNGLYDRMDNKNNSYIILIVAIVWVYVLKIWWMLSSVN